MSQPGDAGFIGEMIAAGSDELALARLQIKALQRHVETQQRAFEAQRNEKSALSERGSRAFEVAARWEKKVKHQRRELRALNKKLRLLTQAKAVQS